MRWRLGKKLGELLVDSVVALLFVSSFASAYFHIRGYEISFSQTSITAIAAVLLVILLSRAWWVTPLVILASGFPAAWFIWRAKIWDDVYQGFIDFYDWAGIYLRFGEPESAWQPLLVFLLILPLSLLLFALVRHLTHLVFYLILTAVVYIPLLIGYPGTFSSLLVALAALLILMPGHFSQTIHNQRPHDSALPRAPMQILAIPLAITSLLFAQLAVPEDTGSWRWSPLVARIQDFEDLWHNTIGGSRTWHGFDIGDYGYGRTGQRLGGPVLLSERTILQVNTETPVLLRGITRTIYTGFSWDRPSRQHFRFASPLWQLIRRQTFNAHLPLGSEGRAFREKYAQELVLRIDHKVQLATLFSAGRVTDVETKDQLNHAPYFTEDSDLFVYSPLPRSQAYYIHSVYFDRSQPGFDQDMILMQETAASETDRNLERVRQNYLQLPDQLPDIVRETAAEVTASVNTDYEKAVLLEAFLKTEFTYSLDPEQPPQNIDFTAHFLETRIGYCVYNATALVVMARTLDIPARYVEGFILEPAGTDNTYTATGQTAHTWAELYFHGIGWLTFDGTPAAEIPDPDDEETPNGIIPPVISPSPEPESTLVPIVPDDSDSNSIETFLAVIFSLAGLAVLIRLMIALARHRHRQRFSPEDVHLKYPNRGRRLEFYYSDLLRQLACLSLVPETGETLQQFAERADAYLRISGHRLPDVLWTVGCLRYGNIEPTDEAILQMAHIHQRIEDRLRQSMTGLTYFIRRVLR